MNAGPIIIVGGGLWGSLLLYKMNLDFPFMDVILYDTSSQIKSQTWTFRKSELDPDEVTWLKPFITKEWRQHRIEIDGFSREFTSPLYTIHADQFKRTLKKSLKPGQWKMVSEVHLEKLLMDANFVFDTRPDPYQKVKCFRKSLGITVELFSPHGITTPVMLNAQVSQKELFRYLQCIPVDANTLILKDLRYSKDPTFDLNITEEELLWEINKRWKIKDVIEREHGQVMIPSGKIRPWTFGRVINLGGLVNLVTGDEFVEAVRLIDQMVKTSFRLGELKEMITQFREEKIESRGFSRLISRLLYHTPHSHQRMQIIKYLYKLPPVTIDRFLSGKLSGLDVARAFTRNPPIPLMRALSVKDLVATM